MRTRRYILGVIALAALAGAGAASAQDEGPQQAPRARMRLHEPGTGLQEGVDPTRRRLGWSGLEGRGIGAPPQALLRQREFLGLTEDQVTRLESIDAELTAARDARREALQAQREEFRAIMAQEDPDAAAIRAATKARLDLQQEAALGQLDAAMAARAVLTDDQQTKLRGYRDGFMRGMRSGRAMQARRGGRGFDRAGGRGPGRTQTDMRRGPGPRRF
jgi:Spy/CpxP family protein refolding chaperone